MTGAAFGQHLDEAAGRAGLTGTALVTAGDSTWQTGDIDAQYVIYSITKSVIAAAFLLGEVDLDASASSLGGDDRFDAPVRHLLRHTSGIPDYGHNPAYHAAVRQSPSQPWSDEEFLWRAHARGPLFAPGQGWAYFNNGYPLLRQILDGRGGLAAFLPALGFTAATVAEDLPDFGGAVPARSALIGDGLHPVAGRYHPGWVGHRTMVTSARDLHRFWSGPPPAFTDPANLVPLGADTGGLFVHATYGLGVLADPRSPIGLIIGHGGGGPGYSAGTFAAQGKAAAAIVLQPTEDFPAQELAIELLTIAASQH
ncbi:MAG: serine hydrolase domain-containing protein [Streptosporangiaceae bacterium]|jgi:D-alanyl-D-alanine carboxypeptidase